MKRQDEVLRKLARVQQDLARIRELLEETRKKSKPWEDWMYTFLDDLERHGGNVSKAIELNEKSRGTIYDRRHRNDEFRRQWDEICSDKR